MKSALERFAEAYAEFMSKSPRCPSKVHLGKKGLTEIITLRPECLYGTKIFGLEVMVTEFDGERIKLS